MMQYIRERNLSLAWLAAMEHLVDNGGKDVNLTVAIEEPGEENPDIRQALDRFYEQNSRKVKFSIETVANTIFPQGLYVPKLGNEAQSHLYKMHALGHRISRRFRPNQRGTYFDRLVAYPGNSGPINQLEFMIHRLQSQLGTPNPKSSAYEIAVSNVDELHGIEVVEDNNSFEMRIHNPAKDRNIMSFPCLSHLSLTLFKKQLHLTATYRNQYFVNKAYGNYLGLSHLLNFICQEVGCAQGSFLCVATHADAEINLGKKAIQALLEDCRQVAVQAH